MSSSKKVLLKSADGESFEVDEAVALESQTIAHIVEDDCMDDGIPLPNVTGKILAMVITFCKKHVEAGDASKSKAGDASKSEAGDASKSKDAADASTSEAAVASKSEAVDGGDSSDEELKAWDAEFMKIDQPTIFELILAANYLNIPKLLDLTCQTVADMIKDKQPEEIRTIFNIKNDFAPEEEQEVRRENQWAFE